MQCMPINIWAGRMSHFRCERPQRWHFRRKDTLICHASDAFWQEKTTTTSRDERPSAENQSWYKVKVKVKVEVRGQARYESCISIPGPAKPEVAALPPESERHIA
jgi:hypothetical protein